MIVDRLPLISTYKGHNTNLDQAIDFLLTLNISELQYGNIECQGDNISASYCRLYPSEKSHELFEAHRKHIDIHVCLHGTENILFSHISSLQQNGEYNKEKDFELLQGRVEQSITLRSNDFALCFPQDAHIPGLFYDGIDFIDKIVIKVSI